MSQQPDRRSFLAICAAFGAGSTLFPGVLWARVTSGVEITPAVIADAEQVAGVQFDADQREMMVDALKAQSAQIDELHKQSLGNSVEPAFNFDPVPPGHVVAQGPRKAPVRSRISVPAVPGDLNQLAFEPITVLSELLRTRKISATQLTTMYIGRLKKYDPQLKCVITITEERALKQAAAADAEIANGKYRGPLHGIPWGAKDLLAARGYKTTWGAGPYKDQTIDSDATVVQRLDAAGAILIAKLSLGELAQGDIWFGGRTNNPWKLDEGSSGSSAGPASATAAGLVAFAIGSETLGSISSPSTRCGVTGLRPTFGRVPRTGAMALSWSMDKLGPLCRSAEDCALVLDAIQGPDDQDGTAIAAEYHWDAHIAPKSLRVGYVQGAFEQPQFDPENPKRQLHPTRKFDDDALVALRGLGVNLVPVTLPSLPYNAMRIILNAEAGAAFDELTRSGRDKGLVQQTKSDWANTFRASRFIPAVDYVNAMRLRSLAIHEWDKLMSNFDAIVTPTSAANLPQLVATNLTGHPAVILPNGFRENGTPVSITFLGPLFGEGKLLALASAYQYATGFQLKHPPLFT